MWPHILSLVREYGYFGLGAATVVALWAVTAKPFFKFLTDDRQNKRTHEDKMRKAKEKAEKALATKGKKSQQTAQKP
jgi:hypothetical protein